MGLADKYRWGSTNVPISNFSIDSLSTLESIKSRQGWMIAAQVATVAAIAHQTKVTTDAIRLVNNTLVSIEGRIQKGFDTIESSIERLETNLLENLSEIKWYLFNIDNRLDQLINLVKFSGATKSAEYNRQGFVLYKIESYEEAIQQLTKSLQENPLNIEAYINIAFVYLQIDNLELSIKNFEMASKLVKEDYSYFENISVERLKSTEIFILDNLATLYSIREDYSMSVDTLTKLLNQDIDLKTEIQSKFKLAKYFCLSKDDESALRIISQLIESQHFDAVSLAVTNPDFVTIRHEILGILQIKLDGVKKKYTDDVENTFSQISNLGLNEEVSGCLSVINEGIKSEIIACTDFSLLLSKDFNISLAELLKYFELVTELSLKVNKELQRTIDDINKIEKIAKYTSNISSLELNDDVNNIAHNYLISVVKGNVQSGITTKLQEFQSIKILHLNFKYFLYRNIIRLNPLIENGYLPLLNIGFHMKNQINSFSLSSNLNTSKDKCPQLKENIFKTIELDYLNILEKHIK
jgi:tetratricopeptide (TPR) repeat protein